MGGKESKNYKPPAFNKQQWEQITNPRDFAKVQQGKYRLLRNILTHEEIQEYLLILPSHNDLEHYLQLFQWREKEQCIVNTKYLQLEPQKDFCSYALTGKTYIEHIPVRLSDIQDIPFPENLYLLLSCLDGFDKLYKLVGYFPIAEDLICMDRDGKVKVWLNPDLSQNHLLGNHESLEVRGVTHSDRLQQKMVEQIIDMIQENTAKQIEVQQSFSEYLCREGNSRRPLFFRQAKQEILNYANKYEKQIPHYFQSIVGIFNNNVSQLSDQDMEDYHKYDQEIPDRNPYDKNNDHGFNSIVLPQATDNSKISSKPVNHISNQYLTLQNTNFSAIPNIPTRTLCAPVNQITQVNRSNLKVNFNYPGSNSEKTVRYIFPILKTQASVDEKSPKLQNMIHEQNDGQKEDWWLRTSFQPSQTRIGPKIVYSDLTDTYQLDSQIAQDMIKYLWS